MKNRAYRSKRSKDRASSWRPARRSAWLFVAAILLGAAIVGFLTRKPITLPPTPAGTFTNAASVDTLPPAEEERSLRAEQLAAARQLVARFPESDDAVYLLGLVHNDQGDSVAATSQWERSLQLDPSRADAHESLGYALLLKDEYEQAEKHLRRALALDVSLISARFRLATTLVHQGRMREAIDLFESVPSSNFTAEMHRLQGEAYHQAKEYQKARLSYSSALRLNPEMPEAHYALSRICAQLGEEDQATNHFERFSALKRESDLQARDVRSNYNTVILTRQSVAKTHTDVGRVYMVQGLAPEAEGLWRRAAALDPTNILCRLQLAVHCQRSNRNPEALRYYEEIARLDPSDALVHLNLGRVSLKMNQFARAEKAFKTVIQIAPDRPEGHDALAQVKAMRTAASGP